MRTYRTTTCMNQETMTEQTRQLAEGIKQGDRSALSRAITLSTSKLSDHITHTKGSFSFCSPHYIQLACSNHS